MALNDARALVEQLRDDLLAARKSRDDVGVTVLRTTLAAIENAEAPPADGPSWPPAGLGADQPRLVLDVGDVRRIVDGERRERLDAADELVAIGQDERATRLRAEAEVLDVFLADR